ncbi:threonine/homoserine exporter RhtA [Chitinimonas sp.]|uniref:threonine/homoserine exporter RhtA n=1 Tax=Chitinimonas sp. TaxID=1934313 RepID=UPI002F922D41
MSSHRSLLLPIACLIGAMASLSTGSSIAKHLFPLIGAQGTTALRVGLAALMLLAFWRPWRLHLAVKDKLVILRYGLVLGFMNLLFYLSLKTIPIGIAVALEFTGPLAVVIYASRRGLDFVWVVCAVVGLLLLLPLGLGQTALDTAGVLYAFGAGVCWALYIVFGQRAGHLHGGQVAALGMSTAALVVLPFGLAQAGSALFNPAILPLALVVAVLSSALPYSLEVIALKHLPKKTFGILLSLEPAMSALAGFTLLGETLTATQWLAMLAIITASVGSAATARPNSPTALLE